MNRIASKVKNEDNVTVLKFKTSKVKGKLIYNTNQTDPLAITDQDLKRAKLGATKIAKKKVHSSFKKITLLTPSGTRIQAVPIDLIKKDQSEKSKNVKRAKNTKRKARSLLLTGLIDSDSDDISIKTRMNNLSRTKKNIIVYNRTSNKITNRPENLIKLSQTNHQKNTKRQNMMDDRSKRKLKRKLRQNDITTRLSQRKTLKDYLPLIEQYRDLIPEKQPYVRLNRLQFNALHFTNIRPRLSSDINLFRDSAILFDLLGEIFNRLDLISKLHSSMVCRLWNRSIKEDTAWQNLPIQNVILYDLKKLERLILKKETKTISLENVEMNEKMINFEFSRLTSVKSIILKSPCSVTLVNKLINACNELENIRISNQSLRNFNFVNTISLRILHAENMIISDFENRILKTWTDLEKLTVCFFDPTYYFNMGLMLSLKYLKLEKMIITYNIGQLIENIPNIQYIEFTPEYSNISYTDGTQAVVESFKHCPSLRKLTWIQGTKREQFNIGSHQTGEETKMCNCVSKMETDNFKTEKNEYNFNENQFADNVTEKTKILNQRDQSVCIMCSGKSENNTYSIFHNPIKNEFQNEEDYIKNELKDLKIFLINSLQSLSLKTYLKMSLPDCEIIVK